MEHCIYLVSPLFVVLNVAVCVKPTKLIFFRIAFDFPQHFSMPWTELLDQKKKAPSDLSLKGSWPVIHAAVATAAVSLG